MSYANYRLEDIEKKLAIAKFKPLDVMVTGNTGAGKSSTLNSLFNRKIAKVGQGVDPETMELGSYSLSNVMRFWDTPGLGDGVANDKIHGKKLIDLLYKTYSLDGNSYGFIDLVIVIVEGINKDMGTTFKLLNEVIIPNFQPSRILVAINQADVAMKNRYWNVQKNKPEPELENFLKAQSKSIQDRVKEATNVSIKRPVYYSAEYGYNINGFYDLIIDNMPTQRRNIL